MLQCPRARYKLTDKKKTLFRRWVVKPILEVDQFAETCRTPPLEASAPQGGAPPAPTDRLGRLPQTPYFQFQFFPEVTLLSSVQNLDFRITLVAVKRWKSPLSIVKSHKHLADFFSCSQILNHAGDSTVLQVEQHSQISTDSVLPRHPGHSVTARNPGRPAASSRTVRRSSSLPGLPGPASSAAKRRTPRMPAHRRCRFSRRSRSSASHEAGRFREPFSASPASGYRARSISGATLFFLKELRQLAE